ncbi:MAG: FtsX-like permease family protein [Acidobacteriota bacterium]|nr:FtsX-like permease family protein [Acidobacteriota bacterium]
MSPLAFAWRAMVRQPARAALGVAGIAAVGALLLDMLMLSRGLVVSFEDLLEGVGYDVRVTSSPSLAGFSPPLTGVSELVAKLDALDEIEECVPVRYGPAEMDAGGKPLAITLIASRPRPRRNWTLLEGEPLSEDPDGIPPVLLNRNLARALEASPGDVVRLRGVEPSSLALPEIELRVSGLAEFPWDTLDERTAATTLAAYARAYGEESADVADLLLVASRPGAGAQATVEAIAAAHPDVHVFSNDHLLRRFRANDFSYFRQISFVLSSITLFFAFLLVSTLLTVSVNQRFAEIAMLRALGFSRRRIVADLLCESLLFVGAGGVLAVPLGYALSRILETILQSIPGIPGRLEFFVLEPRSAVLYSVLLAITATLAALYPVYLAARLPIAATLRKEVVS